MTMNRPSVEEQNIAIRQFMAEFTDFLCSKNTAYGGQAIAPKRIISDAPWHAGIDIRLDDKLSRIIDGENAGEDPLWDICGYIILRKVGERLYAKTDDIVQDSEDIDLVLDTLDRAIQPPVPVVDTSPKPVPSTDPWDVLRKLGADRGDKDTQD